MKVNGINIRQLLLSFEDNVLPSTLQILEAVGCCDELKEALTIIDQEEVEKRRTHSRRQAAQSGRPRSQPRKRAKESDEGAPRTVVGLCPLCGGTLVGMPLPSCETKVSRRVFYGECTKCPYYYEMFKNPRVKKYKKIEGGV